jgi:hypothetical protein
MAKPKGTPGATRTAPAPTGDDGGLYVSGKLVIITVVVLAVLGAGFSWWYRYSSTRRSARFWGGQNARLIRDAAHVHLVTVGPMGPEHVHEPNAAFADHYHVLDGLVKVDHRHKVSQAPGLVHLRNELLMDRSFESHNEVLGADDDWKYGLEFRDLETNPPLVIFFSADCRRLLRYPPSSGTGIATLAPDFAAGLQSVFNEWRKAER